MTGVIPILAGVVVGPDSEAVFGSVLSPAGSPPDTSVVETQQALARNRRLPPDARAGALHFVADTDAHAAVYRSALHQHPDSPEPPDRPKSSWESMRKRRPDLEKMHPWPATSPHGAGPDPDGSTRDAVSPRYPELGLSVPGYGDAQAVRGGFGDL